VASALKNKRFRNQHVQKTKSRLLNQKCPLENCPRSPHTPSLKKLKDF